jgi:peptide/nickel transport system permease protein
MNGVNWQKIWLIGWLVGAFSVWLVAGDSVTHHDLIKTLQGPAFLHPFGYDAFGRDLLPLVFRASAISILFALAVTFASTLAAMTSAGLLTLAHSRLQSALVALLDGALAFPSLIIALAWAAIRGPGWSTLIVALFMGILPGFTRLLYLRAQEILTEDYIEAAIGLGAGRSRILMRYILPELWRLSAVKFSSLFAQTLMAEATLSFLGVGAPIGQDTWGSLLAQGKDYLIEAPHLAITTGLPLVITVLALQGISERWELIANRAMS